ncbi:MAG TPA: SDR family oxidoreductase [Polyangiaceae bacterium]|jgi:short-subunit dehydrogenase|nr:SDR family oxidoreductase [Polyangiaceae bacterium]
MRAPIDGSVAVVTGASSGIGRELARLLAPRVRVLVLVARRRDRLEALARELQGTSEVDVQPCDLGDRDALAALVDHIEQTHGHADILINNAGLGDIGMFDMAPWDKTERMIELNVRALTYLTHRLVRPMVKARRGGILMVSSGFGLTFMPGFAGYLATKHYVTGLSESLRLDVASMGVVVTQLCPGPVATEFEEQAGNFTGMRPQRFVEITAERCARAALAGFERGRAMVIPGLAVRFGLWLAAITPRFVLRLVYGPGARWFRARQDLHTKRLTAD